MSENKDSLYLVKVCGPTEAEMICEMLANNGIQSTLQGKESAEILPATGNLDEVRVWVNPEDAVKADELVTAFFETDMDDSTQAAS